MSLPIELVIVRHGESEGNVANRMSKEGDDSAFTDEFRERHSSLFRLTDVGIQQAKSAGEWLRNEFKSRKIFDRFYASEYVRAMETAALLDLPNAKWFTSFYLRERDWGELDVMPKQERMGPYYDSLRRKDSEPFHWRPPGGESVADVAHRTDRVLGTLDRECSDGRAILVCHGEVMWTLRVLLERISQDEYKELDLSNHAWDRIHNCQILHYSRRHPTTGDLSPHISWMRSICPWDNTLSSMQWTRIDRISYTNEELLARVRNHVRMVN